MVYTTLGTVEKLRREGFNVNYTYLQSIWRDKPELRPEKNFGRAMVWTEDDISRLRTELIKRGRGPKGVQE